MILIDNNAWEIKTSQAKGRGVYAKKDIMPGTIIGDYIGIVIRTAVEDTLETDEGLYLMYYHDQASLYPVDRQKPGVHLINHSCTPNNWMYTYRGHTLFFALRYIFAGEELTISYLLSPDDDCNPCKHICRCESSYCTGTMHQSQDHFDRWSKFSEEQSKQTKRKRIRYGKILPLLSSYPETIPDHEMYDLFGSQEQEALIANDSTLPSVTVLRKMIRETGKTLMFPKINIHIHGIKANKIVT